VIHSFGFHSLGFKSDAIPGRLNFVSLLFLLSSGSYLGYCYELCGLGHSSMLSSLVVLFFGE
jgi:cytochrome c oxidase subunit 2